MEDKNKDSTFPVVRGRFIKSYNKTISSRRCPTTGSFIGYKMVVRDKHCSNHVPNMAWNIALLKLEIPEDARRLTTSGLIIECRCDKVKVLQAYDMYKYLTTHDLRKCRIRDQKIFYSYYYRDFEYKVGEIVSTDTFDDNKHQLCSAGIYFRMNMEDAINYFSITT